MLPGNDSPRLDKNQRIPPPRQVAQEPRPENTAYRPNAARLLVAVYQSTLHSASGGHSQAIDT